MLLLPNRGPRGNSRQWSCNDDMAMDSDGAETTSKGPQASIPIPTPINTDTSTDIILTPTHATPTQAFTFTPDCFDDDADMAEDPRISWLPMSVGCPADALTRLVGC